MPVVYDNWERVLQAVLRREQYLEMAHAHSRSTSAASSVSLDFDELSLSSPRKEKNVENEGRSSRSDFGPSQLLTDSVNSIENNLCSESQNSLITSDSSQNEWTELYEPGVYITYVDFQDGSIGFKQARFSRRRFSEKQTGTWWSENRGKVYNKYNIRKMYNAASRTEGVVPQGINGSKSRNSVGSNKGDANQTAVEWIEQYELGVCVTLCALQDGCRHVKQVAFSRKRFSEKQADTWWSENRGKVYNKYNIRKMYNAASRTEGVVPQGINGSKSRNSVGSNKGDANQTTVKWIEQYELGVCVTLCALQDGSRYVKQVAFSRRRFSEKQAGTWWSENRGKVYNKYNIRKMYNAASRTEEVVPQGINGSKSRNSVGSNKGDANQTAVEWIEQYELGVCVTLCALQDGSSYVKQVAVKVSF